MSNIITIHTYGSQRVKHPATGQMVSAQKLGYTSAASAVLLALYGDRARDVSSKHASYHYVQLDAEVTVRHGYILLTITEAELARVVALTQQVAHPAVYRWRDAMWLAFPNARQAHYAPLVGRTGPNFNPTGMRIVSTTTGEPEAVLKGISVEKSQRNPREKAWYWLRGDTYPHRDLLKRWGCRWSKRQQAWYFIGDALPDAVRQLLEDQPANSVLTPDDDAPCSDAEAERILGVRLAPKVAVLPNGNREIQSDKSHHDAEPSVEIVSDNAADLSEDTSITTDTSTETQPIRIHKPQSMPEDGAPLDDIQSAIVQSKTQPASVLQSGAVATGKRPLAAIGQAYVGELTGSITGNVYCYGYALYEGICVYCNFGGPRMAVEAIRARFSKGEIVNCVPWDAPAIELTAGEGNTGMYTAYMQHLPEAKFASVILCHEWLVNPNYGGKSTTFILRTDEAQAMAKLKHHVTELVKVPVFDAWAGYLYTAGQHAMLVRPTRSAGDIDLLSVTLDVDAWTRLITGGIAQGVINLSG